MKYKNAYKCDKLARLGNSDHHPIFLLPKSLEVNPPKSSSKIKFRDWSSANTDKLVCALETTDWGSLTRNKPDANEQAEIITDYISFTFDDCVPVKVKKLKPDKSWMNGKIRKLLADRHFALSQHQHSKVISIKPKLQCEILNAKVEQSLKLNNFRQSWNRLKSILSLTKPNSQCHLPPDVLNKYYTRFEKYIPPPNISQVMQDTPSISSDSMLKALKSVNSVNGKSAGPDNISSKLLKAAAHSLSEPLCDLFNNCVSQGVYLIVWKSSTIIPIPRNAGANEAKEFRPIALTSTISKLFERLLLKFLKPYLTDTTQFAYQQHRSTEDTLTHQIDIVTNHLDINAKNHARCLFIDFSSAFNTISPTTPCNQLQDTSLNPAVLNLVYDFMTNRSQKVLTEQGLSSTLTTSVGTPQGCVISPLILSIYVQHMPKPSSSIFPSD